MKSSRDIPPRVGMQIRFLADEPKKITAINYGLIQCSDSKNHYHPDNGRWTDWQNGDVEILWMPPTDDERRLFMEAARYQRKWLDPRIRYEHECVDVCRAVDGMCETGCRFDKRAEILESLALDGADYDDMPDFEELER